MPKRLDRVQELIQREVGMLLQETFMPERALLTITRVQMAPDLSAAKIFLSVYPFYKAPQVFAELKLFIPFIQQQLNKRLFMKHVPLALFRIDRAEQEAAEIEKIITLLDKG